MNNKKSISELTKIILSGVGVAMGISVVVLSKLNELEMTTLADLLGLGLASIALSTFIDKDSK